MSVFGYQTCGTQVRKFIIGDVDFHTRLMVNHCKQTMHIKKKKLKF